RPLAGRGLPGVQADARGRGRGDRASLPGGGRGTVNELPWWLVPHGDGVPVEVLRELWANPALREYLLGALAPEGDDPFLLHVGGRELFDDVNRRLRKRDRVQWDEANGGVTILTRTDPLNTAAIAVDFDRILNAARGDSARARELTRDALLHEFGHVVP